uniref:Uncharacterized protein n=1 Tax=Oryza sativa subsp. japonica TaxID=39947 RepID=Q6ZDY0_ORYSJ|nr:hypothetical protein [Oryza sativa Japonica Group]BAC83523.1 hypothetical protein [Oryza sativa Japonica Group]
MKNPPSSFASGFGIRGSLVSNSFFFKSAGPTCQSPKLLSHRLAWHWHNWRATGTACRLMNRWRRSTRRRRSGHSTTAWSRSSTSRTRPSRRGVRRRHRRLRLRRGRGSRGARRGRPQGGGHREGQLLHVAGLHILRGSVDEPALRVWWVRHHDERRRAAPGRIHGRPASRRPSSCSGSGRPRTGSRCTGGDGRGERGGDGQLWRWRRRCPGGWWRQRRRTGRRVTVAEADRAAAAASMDTVDMMRLRRGRPEASAKRAASISVADRLVCLHLCRRPLELALPPSPPPARSSLPSRCCGRRLPPAVASRDAAGHPSSPRLRLLHRRGSRPPAAVAAAAFLPPQRRAPPQPPATPLVTRARLRHHRPPP